jgi:divalent metal cation (Fe/Co/Zn/Cd) transporter
MRMSPGFEFPPEERAIFRRAQRLEGWSMAYIASAAVLLYLTMGSSQAMRTSFFEDVISLVPPMSFLVVSRLARRAPRPDYPYGFHSAVSIGYLTASLALLAMGGFLLTEALIKFASGERATIGGVTLFGHTIWAGWPMLAALVYTSVPSFFLGRAKLKLAPRVHDKILFADAKMNKADWMGEAATAVGVMGVGLGYWWTDPAAAALVSLEILHDGWSNLRAAITDLIDERPKKTDQSGFETLPEELARHMEALDWVQAAEVRLREDGHVFFGEVFVVPRTTEGLVEKIERAVDHAKSLNWRIHDVTIMPVAHL